MDVVNSLKFSIRFLGFREEEDSWGLQVYVYMILQSIIIINLGCFLVDRWHDMDDRIIALKTIIFVVTYFAYSTTIALYWDEYSSMIRLFYDTNYQVPFAASSQRRTFIDSLKGNMNRLNKTWWTVIVFYVTPFSVVPVVTVVIKVTVFSEDFLDVIKQNFSAPFPLYYPEFIRYGEREWLFNILVYVTGYVFHVIYMIFACIYSHLAHVTVLCAITDVEFELKLLRLSLFEMDDIIDHQISSHMTEHVLLNDALKRFQKYLIHHHQDVYRRFKMVNNGIRWIAATVGTTASLFMCMSIYMSVQKDQIVLKMQEGLFFILWAFAMYLFDVCGENVKTEDEKLRNAIFECSWLEKPSWFKKSLIFMLTQSSRSVEIKPFGLYAFNLNSFAKTINAAYSYYNLLYKFKNN